MSEVSGSQEDRAGVPSPHTPSEHTEHTDSRDVTPTVAQPPDDDGSAAVEADTHHEDGTSPGQEATEVPSTEVPSTEVPATEVPATEVSATEGSPERETPASPEKTGPRVSIRTDSGRVSGTPAPKRVSSSRRRMEQELERLRQADENARLRQKAVQKREVQRAVEAVRKEREMKGVTLTPDVEASRAAIRAIVREEERMALAKDQKKLRNETKALQQQIRDKYAMKGKKQSEELMALTQSFYHGKVEDTDGIPKHVQRELTRQEIEDLRMVFDMFDVKGKGFITGNDVKRAASMLGFKAKKEVFSGMIEEVTGDKYGRVTFSHFLQFVVKGQGDGDDPLDAILQCFRLLDTDQKGYITAADLRHAADTQSLPLSNRAIREMIQEADVTGDSKVTSDEFIHLMLQSSMFRTAH